MPLYEYTCRECGHRFELLQRMGEGAQAVRCPRCAATAPRKLLSTFASHGASARTAGTSCGSGSGSGFG
jgi:putative FmdB family regulatory protein